MNKDDKEKGLLLVSGLVLLVVLVVGITYAVFSYTKKGNVENTIRTGKITMSYTEGENGITLENAYPMQDSVGKVLFDTNQMFDFTVNINLYGSKVPVSYEVTAEKDENSTLNDEDVRIYLEKSSDGTNYSAVSEPSGYVPLGTADEFGAQSIEMLLDRGSTNDTVTFNYRLRMWVASTYQVSGEEKYFTLKVNVYGNDGVNVEVNGIELDKASATVKLTNSLQLNATITPASPSDKTITWTSSNEKVAIVTSTGLVETKGIGTATITATASNGKSASANIKVEVDNPNITGAYTYNETTCPTGKEATCEPNTCLVSGTCPAGTAISYKVNDSTTQDFYVLKDNGSTLTLITDSAVVTNIAWNVSGSNVDGPLTVLSALENVTNNWTNVKQVTYNGTTYGSNGCDSPNDCSTNSYNMENRTARARLITVQEATSVGCTSDSNSCPSWLYRKDSIGQWTMSAVVYNPGFAWYITGNKSAGNNYAIYFDANVTHNGIDSHAVVEINR